MAIHGDGTASEVVSWVVDPFAGSGTTGIAVASLGRRYVVIEKDDVEYAKMLRNLEEAERSLGKSS